MSDLLGPLENGYVESTRLLLEKILRNIVSDGDGVTVEALAGGEATIFSVRVAEPDTCKVVGEDGRTVHALRTVLGAAGSRHGQRFILEIAERL